jgi:UPF0716 protein FxsA
MCLIISLFILLATILEVELLSQVASHFGSSNMWLLLIGTGFIGWHLIREQRQMNQKMQAQMMRGEMADPSMMMRPLITLLSGILLIIPGPLTDFFGLILLHPVMGQLVLQKLFKGGLQAMLKNGQVRGGFGGFGGQNPFGGGQNPFGGGQNPFGSDQDSSEQTIDVQTQEYTQEQFSSREGIHPTQKPKVGSKRRRRVQSPSSSQVDPRQVIIDVDAEVVDK